MGLLVRGPIVVSRSQPISYGAPSTGVNLGFGVWIGPGSPLHMVDTRAAAAGAHDNAWFESAARGGFAASGVLHLLVAWIVLRLALGDPGSADQSGALAALSAQTGGAVMLWMAAAVFAALGLWHIVEAAVETEVKDRVKAGAIGAVHVALAFSAAKFAMGSGKSSSQQNAGLSAQMMQTEWGSGVLVLIALVVIGVGGYHVYKGVTRRFLKDLEVSGGSVITVLGITGYVAKGVVLVGAGLLVIVATMTSDPSKATGIDAAVKTIGAAPFGKFLLILAAVGLAAYGVYGFVRSRYAEM